jgi:hypothetical protein
MGPCMCSAVGAAVVSIDGMSSSVVLACQSAASFPHLGGVLKLGFTSSFVPISLCGLYATDPDFAEQY